ncbi:HGGxSTG domain-containing protein [Solemya velum gill symbiont]|uniref:HGGxSTG domain-containing protein n=2 Tax=Solemya velum gill symbiont TaxID=2340 RepID=UPI00277B508A|nr:HGGxSTG domain-containing protein [Solemya velum gill symbiont]
MRLNQRWLDMNDELRKRFIAHVKECERIYEIWDSEDYPYPVPDLPDYPPEFSDLTCGAKTRAGHPCKQKILYSSGRCRYHGGLSTGPKTEEGKAKSVRNWRRRKRTP